MRDGPTPGDRAAEGSTCSPGLPPWSPELACTSLATGTFGHHWDRPSSGEREKFPHKIDGSWGLDACSGDPLTPKYKLHTVFQASQ